MGKREWPARVLRRVVVGDLGLVYRPSSGWRLVNGLMISSSRRTSHYLIFVHISRAAQTRRAECCPSMTVKKRSTPNHPGGSADFAIMMIGGMRTAWDSVCIMLDSRGPPFPPVSIRYRTTTSPGIYVLGYSCVVNSHSSAVAYCFHDPMVLSQYQPKRKSRRRRLKPLPRNGWHPCSR